MGDIPSAGFLKRAMAHSTEQPLAADPAARARSIESLRNRSNRSHRASLLSPEPVAGTWRRLTKSREEMDSHSIVLDWCFRLPLYAALSGLWLSIGTLTKALS